MPPRKKNYRNKGKKKAPTNAQLKKEVDALANRTETWAHTYAPTNISSNNLYSVPHIAFLQPPSVVNRGVYKRLRLNFQIKCGEATEATVVTYPWRLLVVMDKLSGGVPLTNTAGILGLNEPTFNQIPNPDNAERFLILRDIVATRENTLASFNQTAGISNEGYVSIVRLDIALNHVYKTRQENVVPITSDMLNTNALYVIVWCPGLSSAAGLNADFEGFYCIDAIVDK